GRSPGWLRAKEWLDAPRRDALPRRIPALRVAAARVRSGKGRVSARWSGRSATLHRVGYRAEDEGTGPWTGQSRERKDRIAGPSIDRWMRLGDNNRIPCAAARGA